MTACRIGSLQLETPFIAAPMAGISDAPMRLLCREMGASLTYTEMVSGKGLLYGSRGTEELLFLYPGEGPTACQLFGADPQVMEEAAARLAARPFRVLDINMGCPVPKVVKNGEGAALLRHLSRLHEVAAAVVRGAARGAASCGRTPPPVTAKIRLGWDDDSIVAVEAAAALEAAGAAAVAVHGRTRQQFYSGRADWSQIRRVKQAVGIPVIGNGDVFSAADGLRMLEETGCDLVMVGRGMLGNPWIFRELTAAWRGEPLPPRPTREEKKETMLRHFRLLAERVGSRRAVLEMRKHAGWYFRGERGAAALRRRINSITGEAELLAALRAF
jgi:tRNA-dihydrouridine synthase B